MVVLAPPPPEPAPPSPPEPPPEPAPDLGPEHRFELSLAGATFSPSFTDVRFQGSGVPAGGAERKTLSIAGREVGLRRPTFWGAELALGYRHRYFGVLALGSIATIDGVDSTPTNPQAVAQLGAGSVTAYGGGIEAFGAVPLGPFTVSLGAAAGLRGFSAPLLGFEATTCTRSTRRGRYSYPCAETATTNVVAWVQPRVRFDVALDARRAVFLGGFLGVDALGDFSRVGGLVLGLRL